MKLILKKDLLIIACIVLVCLILFLVMKNDAFGSVYEISVDSKLVYRGSIYTPKNHYLDCGVCIVCDGKSVYFEASDCPDKTCISMGELKNVGEWAACLPNKVFLKITEKGELV